MSTEPAAPRPTGAIPGATGFVRRALSHALARRTKRARFELRQVRDGTMVLAAIHDFEPRLPWPVYALTQAPFHKLVMLAFRRHLAPAPRA